MKALSVSLREKLGTQSPGLAPGEAAADEAIAGSPSSAYQATKAHIHRLLLGRLDLEAMESLTAENLKEELRQMVERLLFEENLVLNAGERRALVRDIQYEMLGFGPIEPLLADPTVSDILVNTHAQVYVERRGRLELTEVRFVDDEHLMKIIDKIVSRIGRRVDESSPMVDARLPDGSRVNAIIPPLAIDGPILSIRRFSAVPLRAENLIEFRSMSPEMAQFLAALAQARANILISGGTGSGKTTLLNILSGAIPASERIVTIEDAAELQLQQPHVVRLETRPPNIEGRGEVAQRALVRNALRMRPDRIILGETRGAEALDMLQAMNTGHEGSMTTVHANTPRDALARLESMIAMAGVDLPAKAARAQIASAIGIIVQANRLSDGSRKITSIQELTGMEGDTVSLQEIFSFKQTGVAANGAVQGYFSATGVRPRCWERLNARGVELPQTLFVPQRHDV
ncbi:MAG: CpaF family protein [Comamonadaceae bacterium]|jgi:pilus assembly protein CpaF|nr:CpaF family protein [Comamonadaceae bacterium]